MGRKGHSPEPIVQKLREAETALATGSTVTQAVRQIGISEQTYYRGRDLYARDGRSTGSVRIVCGVGKDCK